PPVAKPDLISRLEEEKELFLLIADEEEGMTGGVPESAGEPSEHLWIKKVDAYSDVKDERTAGSYEKLMIASIPAFLTLKMTRALSAERQISSTCEMEQGRYCSH
ncbi:UNVERIFIED_CONTAM: hypothetical protein K2H54_063151, partial [Gekko kuhli]